LILVAGGEGVAPARDMVHLLDLRRLAGRLQRRNVADAAGFARLVSVVADLSPESLSRLAAEDDARWLLSVAPLDRVASLMETLVDAGVASAEEAAAVLGARLRATIDSVRVRDHGRYWMAVGWIAWTIARYGHSLALGEPAQLRVLQAHPPQVALWATAWLNPSAWTATTQAQAIDQLKIAGGPPAPAWAAAAVLSVAARLGREPDLLGSNGNGLGDWVHALDVGPHWARVLVESALPGTRLRTAFGTDWAPWGVARLRSALAWRSHGWNRIAMSAERALRAL
jgi:hypothetical protein